jgi:hypothetical protein
LQNVNFLISPAGDLGKIKSERYSSTKAPQTLRRVKNKTKMKMYSTLNRPSLFFESNKIYRGQEWQSRACDCTEPWEKRKLLCHSLGIPV